MESAACRWDRRRQRLWRLLPHIECVNERACLSVRPCVCMCVRIFVGLIIALAAVADY